MRFGQAPEGDREDRGMEEDTRGCDPPSAAWWERDVDCVLSWAVGAGRAGGTEMDFLLPKSSLGTTSA